MNEVEEGEEEVDTRSCVVECLAARHSVITVIRGRRLRRGCKSWMKGTSWLVRDALVPSLTHHEVSTGYHAWDPW